MSEHRLKIILPMVILLIGIIGAGAMIKSRKTAPKRPSQEYAPLVRVVIAAPASRRLAVTTQGTVKPRTEASLVSEVTGRVLSVAPAFAAGGFFEKGDVLVGVDPRDYELAVVNARSQVARAEVVAEVEEAQAEVAREEWKTLGKGKESPLATRELQLQEARAALAAAEAALEQAERNLARTRIRAPFAGRVRHKIVDVGQYVSPGVPVAQIYAIDYVEVRLPIPDAELAYVDLPVDYRGSSATKEGPEVRLYTQFAGEQHEWIGRIVRVEGEIDPISRMIHVIAQVDDPYGRGKGEDPMPLAVGLFVQADIMGHEIENAIAVPRSAVREGNMVFVVDDEDRIRFREVDVLRMNRTEAIIVGGLSPGEQVCVSVMASATEGTRVRTTTVGERPVSSQTVEVRDDE